MPLSWIGHVDRFETMRKLSLLRTDRLAADHAPVHAGGRMGGQARMDRIVEVLDTIEILPT
jgi:hypothetical protein